MSRSLFAILSRRHGPVVDPRDRREFMKLTLAAGAAGLLSGVPGVGRAFASSGAPGKRIVIIGGGFAGLACAHELLAVGYDITILEARNRFGGRVLSFSDFIPGRNVEGGGELIGSNHPTWVAYAKKFGLEFLDVTEAEDKHFPVVIGGKSLSPEETEKLYEELESAIEPFNTAAADIDEDEPWARSGAMDLDAKNMADVIRGLDTSDLAKAALMLQFMGDNGVDPEKQSYLANLCQIKGGGVEKYWTESEVYRCAGGNQQLAQKLAETIGNDRLVLNLAARSIEEKAGVVKVTAADGRVLEADEVVLAVPPSVWSKIDFAPALPPMLKPQMGSNVKFLLQTKGRFWLDQGLAPESLTDGEVTMTWEATDNQPVDGPACLVAFSGGRASEQCRSRDNPARREHYLTELGKLYPGIAEQAGPDRFMDWPSDPWTQAGYSFPAPTQVTRMGPRLRKGAGKIQFAGEHTCHKFIGYMEGALNSGVSVARRIAQRDGVAKPS